MTKSKKAETITLSENTTVVINPTPMTFEQSVAHLVEAAEVPAEDPKSDSKKFATGEKPIKPYILAFLKDGPKGKAEIFQHVKKERGGSTARTVIYKMLKTKTFRLVADCKYEVAP
jgi:hypothetical protein